MSKSHKHHNRHRHEDEHDRDGISIDRQAEHYLRRDGLTFDFSAGREKYTYQVGVADEGNDVLVGGKARDYVWGLGGNDKIAGGGENDNLFGDSGNDVITGGAGGDRLVGGMGNDRLFGGDQNDHLMGGAGNDYLDEGKGHGDVDGGPGNDTYVGGQGPDAFHIARGSGHDVAKDFTAGPGMFDHIAVHDMRWEDLSFQNTSAGVKISFDGGSLLLEGVRQSQLAQDDFMFEMSPDLPPSSRDVMGPTPERPSPSSTGPSFGHSDLPGEGFDKSADKAMRDGGTLKLGFRGDESYTVAVGTMGNDMLQGGATWDHLFGRDGNDTLIGNGGDDILQGDAGNDVLNGGAGMNRLDGGMGDDRLIGGAENDELMGMDGNDNIDAGAGHDMIEGGGGNDTIRGGTGADALIVNPMSGNDIVVDFEARGEAQGAFDHLALDEILPHQVRVDDTARGALVSWNTDSDAAAEGSVLLQDVFKADLRQSDFMFVARPGFVAGIEDFGSHYVFPA